ncbi:MAG: hypothetical protein K1X94_01920 [Sandaracinaceae bacterium]|nr:hypothetical protein [Sandaracinaceae bacterium]
MMRRFSRVDRSTAHVDRGPARRFGPTIACSGRVGALVGAGLAAAVLHGCGGGGGTDAAVIPVDAACTVGGGAPPWIVLGTGEASFVELADGGDIELVHGPQGGYHLPATALFGLATSPDMLVLRYDVSRTDGTILGTTQIALNERRLTHACGGWFRGGDIVVLSITAPAAVADADVDLVVSVLDADGEVVRDARRLHVVDALP